MTDSSGTAIGVGGEKASMSLEVRKYGLCCIPAIRGGQSAADGTDVAEKTTRNEPSARTLSSGAHSEHVSGSGTSTSRTSSQLERSFERA